jgi:hypothetical protein
MNRKSKKKVEDILKGGWNHHFTLGETKVLQKHIELYRGNRNGKDVYEPLKFREVKKKGKYKVYRGEKEKYLEFLRKELPESEMCKLMLKEKTDKAKKKKYIVEKDSKKFKGGSSRTLGDHFNNFSIGNFEEGNGKTSCNISLIKGITSIGSLSIKPINRF